MAQIECNATIGGIEAIEKIAIDWRSLSASASEDQPFYRPEWIAAYLRAFAPRAKLILLTARVRGELLLVLPLIYETGTFSKVPVRKLRAPVNFWAGRFDATCKSGPEGDSVIAAAWSYLGQLPGWDVLSFRDSLHGSVVKRLAVAAREGGFNTVELADKPSPIVPIPCASECRKLLPVNARLRRELRSIRRTLEQKQTSVKLHRVEVADRDALRIFFGLEASGWKGQERSAILLNGESQFFEDVASAAARFGYFTLYLLELDGEFIAGQYGFTLRDTYYSVVVAYNEKFREYSPGHLLIDEIVHDCATRGVRSYQTMGQNQDWKMRWTNQTQPMSHHYVFRGPIGNFAYSLESKIRPRIAHLLGRRERERSLTLMAEQWIS